MRQIYKALICITTVLICLVGVNIPAEANEPILRQISVGYWDIWRHSDGVTWQNTGKPGDIKEYKFELSTPAELAEYENIDYKIKPIKTTYGEFFSETEYLQHGGWVGMSYIEFDFKILQCVPQNYQQKTDKTVSFKLSGTYKDIKKDWQGQKVEGRRYYLPVLVEWYGEEKPKEKINLVARITTRTEMDEFLTNSKVTYKAELKNESNVEITTDYIWQMDEKISGPHSIILPPNNSKIVTKIYTAPPTAGAFQIFVEVNPNRNKPAEERTYVDNRSGTSLLTNPPDLPERKPDGKLRGPGLSG